MYLYRLRLPLPKGVLPYIGVVDELLLLTQVIKEWARSKYIFKKQHILHQQLIKMQQLKQKTKPKYDYSSSQNAKFHPLLRVSRDHSTFQP